MKRQVKRIFGCMVLVIALVLSGTFPTSILQPRAAVETPILKYRTHIQRKGWTSYAQSGVSGSVGQGLRMEAMQIEVSGVQGLGVRYRAHVQGIGWQSYAQNGAVAGTTGKKLRLEAIQIELTGEKADLYDIYYRAHVQSYGWLDWAKNGEEAGSQGYGKRMEAIEIRILPKGMNSPQTGKKAFEKRYAIDMQAHVQSYGWQSKIEAGNVLGTVGKGKRLEAVKLTPVGYDMNIEYSVHVQKHGWMAYVKNGQLAGTSGQSLRLEAIKIRLSGNDASKYDIYYRAHIQGAGWLDWAKNDEPAGSSQAGLRMEALDVRLVPKGEAAPGGTSVAYVSEQSISYRGNTADAGWQNYVEGRKTAGVAGKPMTQVQIKSNVEGLGVSYSIYENGAWSEFFEDDAIAGKENVKLEAIKIKLTGSKAKYYTVYYRVESEKFGWLGWTSNGKDAGTATISKPMRQLQIVVLPKGASAPGATTTPFRNKEYTEAEAYAYAKLNEIGWNLQAAFNWSSSMSYTTRDTTVKPGYTRSDWYAIFGFTTGGGNCYNMAATFYQMAKLLGYEVYYVQGYLPQANGRKVTHGWVELIKDGKLYVCDPNFTYNRRGNGLLITYGQKGTWRYIDYQRMD